MQSARPALVLMLLVSACGGAEPSGDDAPEASGAAREATVPAPCDVLSTVVPAAFDVEIAEIEFDPSSEGTAHPYCDARWRSSEAASYADAKAFLTVAGSLFDDADATVSALEGVVGSLREGVTVEAGGTEATFQSDYTEWIEDIGEAAAWNPRMSQVSAAAGRIMFHLQVRVTGDEAQDKALATDLARRVVEELQ